MAQLKGIKLEWDDMSDFEEGFKVYRSATSFDENSLPAVYATLPPNSTSYLDEDVEEGTTYYYMLSTFAGGTEVFFPATKQLTTAVAPGPIGSQVEGGILIGLHSLDETYGADEGTYAIIMAPRPSSGTEVMLAWKNVNTATTGTDDLRDGLANTLACINANGPGVSHPAAEYCVGYSGGGYSDWYLPSYDELLLVWTNRLLLDGSADTDGGTYPYYWSSTQSGTYARVHELSTEGNASSVKVALQRVRPVRRVKIA